MIFSCSVKPALGIGKYLGEGAETEMLGKATQLQPFAFSLLHVTKSLPVLDRILILIAFFLSESRVVVVVVVVVVEFMLLL